MFTVLKKYMRRQLPNTYQRLDAAMDEVRRSRVRRLRTVLPLAESMYFTVQAGLLPVFGSRERQLPGRFPVRAYPSYWASTKWSVRNS